MALSAPAPPLSPDACLSSAPAHGPATTTAAISSASSPLTALVYPSSLSPSAQPFSPRAGGKEQRWCDASPSSGGSPNTRSFRDVLLGDEGRQSAPPSTAPAVSQAPTKFVLKSRPRQPLPLDKLDGQGWQRVQSRRARKSLRRQLHGPRRPVPVDLWGKCFNCFSPAHRAVMCRSRPRCFWCQERGHFSSKCTARPRRSSLLWRPVSSNKPPRAPRQYLSKTVTVAPHLVATAVGATAGDGGQEGSPRRRRHHVRKRRSPQDTSCEAHAGLTAEEEDDQASPPPALPTEDQPKLRHFIDCSARIARAEEDLGSKALSVAIVGDSTTPLVDVLAAELARRYEHQVRSLEFHRLDHGDYLLILANEEVA
jgi:hypothetical protein